MLRLTEQKFNLHAKEGQMTQDRHFRALPPGLLAFPSRVRIPFLSGHIQVKKERPSCKRRAKVRSRASQAHARDISTSYDCSMTFGFEIRHMHESLGLYIKISVHPIGRALDGRLTSFATSGGKNICRVDISKNLLEGLPGEIFQSISQSISSASAPVPVAQNHSLKPSR
jgi:hypothetical protein